MYRSGEYGSSDCNLIMSQLSIAGRRMDVKKKSGIQLSIVGGREWGDGYEEGCLLSFIISFSLYLFSFIHSERPLD